MSLKQAQLTLTTLGMEEAEQRELLIKAGLISTSEEMSAQSVFEALSKDAVSTADQKEIMMELGLVDGKSKTLIATNKCTEAELRSILTKRGYIGAQQDEIVSEILGTSVRGKSAISWEVLSAKIGMATKSLITFLFTNPVGWIILATAATIGLVKGYDAIVGRQEKLSRKKIEGIDENISELNEEIDALETLQKKLESAKGNRTELSAIYQELNSAIGETQGLLNGESQAWDIANTKLKANIELKKEQRKQAQKDKVDESKLLYDSNSMEIGWRFDLSGDKARKYAQALSWMNDKSFEDFYNSSEYKKLSNLQSSLLWEAVGFRNSNEEEWAKYWQEQVDTAYNVFEETISNYEGAGGKDFIRGLISDMVTGGLSLTEISDVITQVIDNNDMQDAINKYWESLVNPDIDSEKALSSIRKLFDGFIEEVPSLKDFFDSFYNNIISGGEMAVGVEALNKQLAENKQVLEDEYQKAKDWGLESYLDDIKNGTIQSTFGNVDMDKRTIIAWSDELKETYKDALKSWDYDPEIGSIDTVFGGSDRFGENLNGVGWEVAFTPILPDGTFLSKETVYEYINKIIAEAYQNDGQVTEDELKVADAQGRLIGDTFVKGIFAAVDEGQNYENNGNWAETVGRLMHFSGDFGAVRLAEANIENTTNKIAEAAKNASKNVDKMTVSLKELSESGDKIKSLSSASKELSDNGYITVKTLQDIQEAAELTGDEWSEYEAKLLGAKAGSSEFNQALSELTYKILDNKFNTIDLTNATEQEIAAMETKIATMLKENGVLNANEVAHEYVKAARVNEAIATYDGTQASYDSATALINESLSAEQAKVALNQLELAKLNVNKAKITSSDDIDNIIAIANAAGATIKTLNDLARAKEEISLLENRTTNRPNPGLSSATRSIMGGTYNYEYEKLNPSDFKVGAPKYSGGSSSKSGSGGSGSSKDKKEVEAYTAEIEKFAEAQQKLADATANREAIERQIERERDPNKQLALQADLIAAYEAEQVAMHELNEERDAYISDSVELLRQRGFEVEYDPETNRLVVKNMEHLNELVASSKGEYESLQEATNEYIKENEELIKNLEKVNEENQKTSEEWAKTAETIRSINLERLSTALKSIEKEYDDYKDYIDEVNEGLDKQIKKEKGLQDVLKKSYDAINSLTEAQHEMDKSIADSRISKAYLNASEYAKIFNEEDYQAVSNSIKNIQGTISTLTRNFKQQIIDAYNNDQAYLVEHITAEYERQVELKMKEIEIVKAELDYTKKQTELNNILSERNIKQLVERNGKFEFEWVADQEKVRQATEELADAKYNMEKLSNEQTQQIQLNEYDRRISQLSNIQEANNKKVEDFGKTVDTVKDEIDKLKDPVANFGASIQIFQSTGVVTLSNAINDVISALAKFTGSTYDKIVVPNGKAPVQVNPDGKAPKGLSAGTVVKTNGGNYLITSINADGSYKSTKLTGYASGTKSALKGWHEVDENGNETYISKMGTFHSFSGGEPVFNAEQTHRLWNLSKIDLLSTGVLNSIKDGFKNIVPLNQNQSISNEQHFGDIVINNPADFNDFVRQFKNAIQRKTV